MTRFAKWWEANSGEMPFCSKEAAHRVWQAAQRALLSVLFDPPYVPKVGEKVRLLSLCHPRSLGLAKEVVALERGTLEDVYWITTRDAAGNTTTGLLGEAEPVAEGPVPGEASGSA